MLREVFWDLTQGLMVPSIALLSSLDISQGVLELYFHPSPHFEDPKWFCGFTLPYLLSSVFAHFVFIT